MWQDGLSFLRQDVGDQGTAVDQEGRELDRLRIFVSSTMEYLQPERDAVAEAISTFRFEALRAETRGGAAQVPSRDVLGDRGGTGETVAAIPGICGEELGIRVPLHGARQ